MALRDGAPYLEFEESRGDMAAVATDVMHLLGQALGQRAPGQREEVEHKGQGVSVTHRVGWHVEEGALQALTATASIAFTPSDGQRHVLGRTRLQATPAGHVLVMPPPCSASSSMLEVVEAGVPGRDALRLLQEVLKRVVDGKSLDESFKQWAVTMREVGGKLQEQVASGLGKNKAERDALATIIVDRVFTLDLRVYLEPLDSLHSTIFEFERAAGKY
ncbi:unnamed protein product, partial [Prorocentrum cordatum]